MNPKAWMKSANLYSLCSVPFATVHPVRAETAFFSSGPESFPMLLLSFVLAVLAPAEQPTSVKSIHHILTCYTSTCETTHQCYAQPAGKPAAAFSCLCGGAQSIDEQPHDRGNSRPD